MASMAIHRHQTGTMISEQFAKDVYEGLESIPKFISSKYFYDETGDALFKQIMSLPEYYLTKSEFEILDTHKQELLQQFLGSNDRFELIDFGAGDGLKTRILLQHFTDKEISFTYHPIDISGNALNLLVEELKVKIPGLSVHPMQDEYFGALNNLKESNNHKVVLFMGSNIGNFTAENCKNFLTELGNNLNSGDLLMIGMDLVKDPSRILAAYNDSQGVTRDFNLNLLRRINSELGGDFQLDKFSHYAVYDPLSAQARSYLVSKADQTVRIDYLDNEFKFKRWELIHTEISQKFYIEDIETMAINTGFQLVKNYFDCKHEFTDSLWIKT